MDQLIEYLGSLSQRQREKLQEGPRWDSIKCRAKCLWVTNMFRKTFGALLVGNVGGVASGYAAGADIISSTMIGSAGSLAALITLDKTKSSKLESHCGWRCHLKELKDLIREKDITPERKKKLQYKLKMSMTAGNYFKQEIEKMVKEAREKNDKKGLEFISRVLSKTNQMT